MTSLSPLIPPEWIAMQNDVRHTFSASKIPYQWKSCWHISDSLSTHSRQTLCCSDSCWCECAVDPCIWRLLSSFRLMVIKEMSCHSTSSLFRVLWRFLWRDSFSTGSEIGEKLSEWSNGLFMYVGMITGNLELLVLANRAVNTPKSRHTRERSSEEEGKGTNRHANKGVLGNQWTSFVVYDEQSLHSEQKQTLTQLVTTLFACEIW